MRQEVMSLLRGLIAALRGGGKIIAFSRLTEKGREKNMGIAANLIKMLVASTYGLHYGIRLPVVTPIGLYLWFFADGGRPAVPLRPKDHKGNLQVDSDKPLVWLWLKHMPTFSTNVFTQVQRVASGLERLQMSLSHFDDTLHAQRRTPRLRHRWRPSGGNPLPIFSLDQPRVFSLRFGRQKSEHANDYCWPVTGSKLICCRLHCRRAKSTWRLENTLEESHGHACPSQDVRSKARPCWGERCELEKINVYRITSPLFGPLSPWQP